MIMFQKTINPTTKRTVYPLYVCTMKDPELLLTDQIKNKNDYTGYVPFPSTHEKKERTVKPKQNKTNLKKQRYMKLRNSKDTTE